MTNREWLRKLSDKELAEELAGCGHCAYKSEDGCEAPEGKQCADGAAEWLKKEHEKPMPEIKAGDYIVYEKDGCLCRAVCVFGNIVYRIDRGGCCNYGGEMQEKTISIKRYDITNGTLEDIWRADNGN